MKDIFIIGGARTPMTDYTGALRDVSALEIAQLRSTVVPEMLGQRVHHTR